VQSLATKLNALQPLVLSHRFRHEAASGNAALLANLDMAMSDVAPAADVSFVPDIPEVAVSSSSSVVLLVLDTSLMFDVSISVPSYKIPH
jgi:hypothetical protein